MQHSPHISSIMYRHNNHVTFCPHSHWHNWHDWHILSLISPLTHSLSSHWHIPTHIWLSPLLTWHSSELVLRPCLFSRSDWQLKSVYVKFDRKSFCFVCLSPTLHPPPQMKKNENDVLQLRIKFYLDLIVYSTCFHN